jgi:hypothetical protein
VHLAVDPDQQLITAVAVTPANTANREVIDELPNQHGADTPADTKSGAAGSGSAGSWESKDFEVYGDSAYADGAALDERTTQGHDMRTKMPPARSANGFSEDRFTVDVAAGTVTCPAHRTVAIRAGLHHRVARFGALRGSYPLRADRTPKRANGIRVGSTSTEGIGWWRNARSATSLAAPGAAETLGAADTSASCTCPPQRSEVSATWATFLALVSQ